MEYVLALCILSTHGLYMYQVKHKFIEWFQSYEVETISTAIISKMHYSCEYVAIVLILGPLSVHGPHLKQISRKYLERFQSY